MKKGQRKSHSLAESLFNVVVGFAVSYFANLIVLPWFGFNVSRNAAPKLYCNF